MTSENVSSKIVKFNKTLLQGQGQSHLNTPTSEACISTKKCDFKVGGWVEEGSLLSLQTLQCYEFRLSVLSGLWLATNDHGV